MAFLSAQGGTVPVEVSEEPTPRVELQRYLENMADQFQLKPHIQFRTPVTRERSHNE